MTIRDEEILNASTVYHEEQFHCDGWNYDFIEGAKWADQNPREGLLDKKKICQIIHEVINSDTIVQYLLFDDENIDFDSELFFEDLRKAMEENNGR